MRRFFVLIVFSIFGLATIQPTSAIDISKKETGITFTDAATSGSTHAVVWSRRSGKEGSKVVVSYKRGSGAWTAKKVIGSRDWSHWTRAEVAVTSDGTIFVAWSGDEKLEYRELAPNSNTWSSIQYLVASDPNAYWSEAIDVVASGNAITVAGVLYQNGENPILATMSRNDVNPGWQQDYVGLAWPAAEFEDCPNANKCEDQMHDIQLISNSAGVQAVAWISTRIRNQNYNLKNSTFALMVAKREGSHNEWGNIRVLSSLNPKVAMDNYAFFIEDMAVTESGQVGIAYRNGFNNNPTKGFVSVSSEGSLAFSAIDNQPINSKGEVNTIKLTAVGANIWGVVESTSNSGGWTTRVGKIGSFAKAKTQASIQNSYRVLDLVTVGNLPNVMLVGNNGKSPRTLYSAAISNASTTTSIKAVRALASTSSYIESYNFAQGNKVLAVLSGGKGNNWGIGLDAVLL